MTPDDGRARDERRASRPSSGPSAAAFAGVGLQLGMTLALFAWLGFWLDRKLGTSPWLLLLLVFVGAGAGFYSIYRRVIGTGSGSSRTLRGTSRDGSSRPNSGA